MANVQELTGWAEVGVADGAGGFTTTDLAGRVRAISTTRGRTVGSLGLPNTGTATLTLGNADGALTFDSADTAGAIRPGSPVTIYGRLNTGLGNTDTEVFTGTVLKAAVTRNRANTDEVVELHLADGLRQVVQEPAGGILTAGAGDTPTQRINRILDNLVTRSRPAPGTSVSARTRSPTSTTPPR